jgi:hypothetical protein
MLTKLQNGSFTQYTMSQLRAANPNVSFPQNPTDETLAEYDVYRAEISPPEGQQWAGGFSVVDGAPTPIYEDIPDSVILERQAEEDHRTAYQQNFEALKNNIQARQLLKATPAQIDNYIETNVTNLASAKEVLKLLAKAVSVLAHEVYK